MSETPKQAAGRLAESILRKGFQAQALHTYTDASGEPLYWRIRARHPESGEKWIRPMKLNGKGFVLGEPEYPDGKPLYRLHELAARPTDPVLIVEGESCADVLATLGVLATTSGAADSAAKADWRALAGREITVWPDNDEAGRRYADEVAKALEALGCIVRTLDVSALDLPPKGDVVDWLKAHPGANAADVVALPILNAAQSGEAGQPRATEPSATTEAEFDDARVTRLAKLSALEYDRARGAEAKAMGVRPGTLDKLVKAAQAETTESEGIDFDDVEPWPDPVEPAELLSDLARTVQRFIVCPTETADAAALWIAMSWFMDVVQIAPLAVITAPEKRCGKSQLLFLLGRLVCRPLAASNITPAALFRVVDAWKPTLLVDEADAFMNDNEELRGLLNCGHTRDSAYIIRTVGDEHIPTRFNVWGAKALAGIGHLADTIMDRAITLELRRKLPHESVDRLRYAEPGLFEEMASKLARFAEDSRDTLCRCRPALPQTLHDRAQDNWEPLLAIASIAGDDWPKRAWRAALKLSGNAEDGGTVGNELLADIREVFELRRVVKISTADLITALCDDDEKPWATYNRGKPITPRQVAKKLKEYNIASKTIRISYDVSKGFERSQFEDAFTRYLASPPSACVTTLQASIHAGLGVTDDATRYGNKTLSVTPKPAPALGCNGVTDKTPESPDNDEAEVVL